VSDDTTDSGRGLVEFLASLRVTLALLVLLGVVCALGTLVPLTSDWAEFRRFLIGGVGRFFVATGLCRPFASTVFRCLLGCLAVNLIVCTARRLPALVAAYVAPSPWRDAAFFEQGQFRAGGATPVVDVEAVLAGRGYAVAGSATGDDGTTVVLARRGALAPFGPQVTHIGVLLLFLGGVVGWYGGYEGYVEAAAGSTFAVYEGDYYRAVQRLRTLDFAKSFYLDLEREGVLREEDVRTYRDIEAEMADLSKQCERLAARPRFQVRVLSATEEHYTDGGVRDWTSVLQAERDGSVLTTGVVEVNVPLAVDDVMLYQHSFSQRAPGDGDAAAPGVPSASCRLVGRTPQTIAATGASVELLDYYPDFAIEQGPDGVPRAYSRTNEAKNRAVKIRVLRQGVPPRDVFLFAGPPYAIHEPDDVPWRLRLADVTTTDDGAVEATITLFEVRQQTWTGVSVQHDPGTPLVWAGSLLILVGMALSFFVERKSLWLARRPDGTACLAGAAQKFPGLFRDEFVALSIELGLTAAEGEGTA